MKTLRKPMKGVDMETISDNRFLFTFYNRADMEQVIERRPWTFEHHALLMEEISLMEQPSRVVSNKGIFRMRMYDLPTSAMKENIIRELGRKAG